MMHHFDWFKNVDAIFHTLSFFLINTISQLFRFFAIIKEICICDCDCELDSHFRIWIYWYMTNMARLRICKATITSYSERQLARNSIQYIGIRVWVCIICVKKMRLSLYTHFFSLTDRLIFNVKNILWCLLAYRSIEYTIYTRRIL